MSDSEQESYSLDEMVNRLRSRSGEEGSVEGEPELVTREDGSQVMRVRKRKRRSQQPHKEAEAKRRKKSLAFAALVVAVVFVVGLSVLGWILYLNSSGYSGEVVARVEAWTGADVEMSAFRATPVSAAADVVEMKWAEDHPVASLRFHAPRCNLMLSSHLSDIWRGQSMNSGSGELVLRAARGEGEASSVPEGEVPFRVPMSISRLNVKFGDGERSVMGLYETSASMTVPDPTARAVSMIFEGGRTRIRKWGSFDLDSASFSLSPSGLKLGSMRFHPEGNATAKVRLSGEALPGLSLKGGKSELVMEMREMPSEFLLGSGLGALLEASFETADGDKRGRLRVDLTDLDSIEIDVPVIGTRKAAFKLYRFQMFDILSQTLGSSRFAQPQFDYGSSLRVTRRAGEVRLSELELDAQDTMRLRGEIVEKNGALLGELKVGLPKALIDTTPSRELPLVFTRAEGNYRWATVKLGGTPARPTDDLESQFTKALEGHSPVRGGGNTLEDEFLDLTSPE